MISLGFSLIIEHFGTNFMILDNSCQVHSFLLPLLTCDLAVSSIADESVVEMQDIETSQTEATTDVDTSVNPTPDLSTVSVSAVSTTEADVTTTPPVKAGKRKLTVAKTGSPAVKSPKTSISTPEGHMIDLSMYRFVNLCCYMIEQMSRITIHCCVHGSSVNSL